MLDSKGTIQYWGEARTMLGIRVGLVQSRTFCYTQLSLGLRRRKLGNVQRVGIWSLTRESEGAIRKPFLER